MSAFERPPNQETLGGSDTEGMCSRTERDMNVQTQISDYMTSRAEGKRRDMQALHAMILRLMPDGRLWFLDGKDERGRTVSNPNIGYGLQTMTYADGRTREFYQIGMSANTTGLSVYIMGLKDKSYLGKTYGSALGKARVTGYCIKFRTLRSVNVDILEAALRDGIAQTST